MLNFRKLNCTMVHWKPERETVTVDFIGSRWCHLKTDSMFYLFIEYTVDHCWNHNSQSSGKEEEKDYAVKTRGWNTDSVKEVKRTNPIGMTLWVMSLSLFSSCQKWYISRGNQTIRAVGRTTTAKATRVKYFLLEKHQQRVCESSYFREERNSKWGKTANVERAKTCCAFWTQGGGSKTEPDRWGWSPCCWSESWCSSTTRTTSTDGRKTRDTAKQVRSEQTWKAVWGEVHSTVNSLPSMSQHHGFPTFGWGRRISHRRTQPGGLELFAAAISAKPTGSRLVNQSDSESFIWSKTFWYESCLNRKCVNLPGDGPSRSLWRVISCIWLQRRADRRILWFLSSIPTSDTHKSHC